MDCDGNYWAQIDRGRESRTRADKRASWAHQWRWIMRRRRVLIIAACIFVAAVLTVVLWPREREPKYQGKKLSEWIRHAPPPNNITAWSSPRTTWASSKLALIVSSTPSKEE